MCVCMYVYFYIYIFFFETGSHFVALIVMQGCDLCSVQPPPPGLR